MGDAAETSYLEMPGVQVTNARAVLGEVTYSIANITSVRTIRTKGDPAPAVIAVLVGAAFVVVFCRCAGQVALSWVIAGLALAVMLWIPSRFPLVHVVVLCSASGESHAYADFQEENCRRVAEAITAAIIARG
jgi:hypothetical protein